MNLKENIYKYSKKERVFAIGDKGKFPKKWRLSSLSSRMMDNSCTK